MSKEKPSTPVKSTVMVRGFEEKRFNTFLGKILTIVESFGLPQGQETAAKSIIKQEIWELWENAQYIEEKEVLF